MAISGNSELLRLLPALLPMAIAWGHEQSRRIARTGRSLSAEELDVARQVGVREPERIRVLYVPTVPMPYSLALRAAAIQAGMFGPHVRGMTLGYGIFVAAEHASLRLLSHEFRHVWQYEEAGSIDDFLTTYLTQIVTVGYYDAPLELDARAHEVETPPGVSAASLTSSPRGQ
jgi:hypothetical protein